MEMESSDCVKLPIKFRPTSTKARYTVVDAISGHQDARLIMGKGGFYSAIDVAKISYIHYIEYVSLVEIDQPNYFTFEDFHNKVFKVILRDDDTYFGIASGNQFSSRFD